LKENESETTPISNNTFFDPLLCTSDARTFKKQHAKDTRMLPTQRVTITRIILNKKIKQ